MKTAIFAHPKETLPEKSLLPNKKELFLKLLDRDIQPLLSFNGEQAFTDNGVEVSELMTEQTTRAFGDVALCDIGVVVNRLDRSFKQEDMRSAWDEAPVPISNENAMRSLVFRKHRVQDEVLEPLGLGMPSLLVESALDAERFMEEHPADQYIVKPTSGTFSKGVERLQASQVMGSLRQPEKLGSVIIQPAFDFTIPMPKSMKPFDRESGDEFEIWARSNATKELRMYGFYDGEKTDVFPVARAMKDGQDHWIFVDPESLPDELAENTKRVLSSAADLTGSRAIYAALDIGYGSISTDKEPGYHVVELNGRMPYMIGYDKHAGVADTLRDMYANQLQTIANSTISRGVE